MADENEVTVSVQEPVAAPDFTEAHKELAKKFGVDNMEQLRNLVGSNSTVALKVLDDLIAEKTGSEKSAPVPLREAQSPQEHNITGKLDHTGDVATRIKEGAAAELPVAK